MGLAWNAWALPGLAVAGLEVVLAFWVFSTRPARAQNRWLALMLYANGLYTLAATARLYLLSTSAEALAVSAVFLDVYFVSTLALLLFFATLPVPFVRGLRQPWLPVALLGVALAFVLATAGPWGLGVRSVRRAGALDVWLTDGAGPLYYSAIALAVLVPLVGLWLTWLGARRAETPAIARQLRSMFVAFSAYAVVFLSSLLLVAAALPRFDDPPASVVGLVILGQFVAPFLLVAGLTYAILKTQVLGIDVKLKWTLTRSTMAAIFIAVFFVVSEAAAAFFTARAGTYLGIVAAGVLVFAIVPLQRLAERVGDRALPNATPVAAMDEAGRLTLYRDQLEVAYLDGTVDANERRLLEVTRERLGITAEQAMNEEQSVLQAASKRSQAGRGTPAPA